MFFSDDVLEDIRSGNDIVDVVSSYVALKQKGSSYFGLCPFHRESTPSFSVQADKQFYHCFGCGASGNVIGFIMQLENYDFQDAVKFLADRIRYDIPDSYSPSAQNRARLKEQVLEINKEAARFYYDLLQNDGAGAAKYLDERKISENARKKFGLGFTGFSKNPVLNAFIKKYDEELLIKSGLVIKGKSGGSFDRFFNRLMFPIFDLTGKVVGFGGRIIGEGEPKYLNSPDTIIFEKSKNLYGVNFARKARMEQLILVEGYMDVISLYQQGFFNVSAALGTAINQEHIKTIKKAGFKSVLLLFDSDEAGEKAALRAIPFILQGGLNVRILQVKNAKDPDEFINLFGRQAFTQLLEKGSMNHIMFRVNILKKNHDIDKTDEKILFLNETARLIATLDNAMEQEAYITEIAKAYNISSGAISKEVNRLSGKPEMINIPARDKQAVLKDTLALDSARRGVLNAICKNEATYNIVSKCVSAKELMIPVYIKFFEICGDLYKKRGAVYSAEAMNYFETPEEQRVITSIFTGTLDSAGLVEFKKELTQRLELIKTAYYGELLSKASNIDEMNTISTKLRNIKGSINLENLIR